MNRGYIRLFRCIHNNDMWDEKPFDRARAWIDLLLLANHKQGYLRIRGVRIVVNRGDVGYSVVALSEKWGWSRGKTIRFLNELETVHQIVQQKNNVTSLITIVNYDLYQSSSTADDTASSTADVQQTDTNKNNKNEKKIKTSSSSLDEAVPEPEFYLTKKKKKLTGKRLDTFNQFWDAFNYPKGKADAADAWLDIPLLTDNMMERIISAAKATTQKRFALKEAGKTPQMAQGWLSGRRWEDESEGPVSTGHAQAVIPDHVKETYERMKAAGEI